MSKENQGELIVRLLKAKKELNPDDRESANSIASYLYIPDPRITNYLERLREYIVIKDPTSKRQIEAGNLLEEIVVLIFCGLKGISSIKSFRSAGPQYDLLVSGDDDDWLTLIQAFYLEPYRRDIVIEAKCTKDKVSDSQFARLCSLMEFNLPKTTGLGIFFTLNGASGFPERGGKRQQHLTESKLRQVLYHAKTNKAIIVLDAEDIFALNKPASFVQIVTNKIRELEYISGLEPLRPCSELIHDLPKHLEPLIKKFL